MDNNRQPTQEEREEAEKIKAERVYLHLESVNGWLDFNLNDPAHILAILNGKYDIAEFEKVHFGDGKGFAKDRRGASHFHKLAKALVARDKKVEDSEEDDDEEDEEYIDEENSEEDEEDSDVDEDDSDHDKKDSEDNEEASCKETKGVIETQEPTKFKFLEKKVDSTSNSNIKTPVDEPTAEQEVHDLDRLVIDEEEPMENTTMEPVVESQNHSSLEDNTAHQLVMEDINSNGTAPGSSVKQEFAKKPSQPNQRATKVIKPSSHKQNKKMIKKKRNEKVETDDEIMERAIRENQSIGHYTTWNSFANDASKPVNQANRQPYMPVQKLANKPVMKPKKEFTPEELDAMVNTRIAQIEVEKTVNDYIDNIKSANTDTPEDIAALVNTRITQIQEVTNLINNINQIKGTDADTMFATCKRAVGVFANDVESALIYGLKPENIKNKSFEEFKKIFVAGDPFEEMEAAAKRLEQVTAFMWSRCNAYREKVENFNGIRLFVYTYLLEKLEQKTTCLVPILEKLMEAFKTEDFFLVELEFLQVVMANNVDKSML